MNEIWLKRFMGKRRQLLKQEQLFCRFCFISEMQFGFLLSTRSVRWYRLAQLAVGKKVETQARQIYVSTLEEAFIKKGIDTRVTALGSDRNQMRISYALMSRPLVYKFQNELNLDEKAKSFGFKKLVYTNGLDGELGETWTIDIK